MTGPTDPAASTTNPASARTSRRVRVIVNANAGSKGGVPTNTGHADEAEGLLRRHGLEAQIVASESTGEARALAAAAVRDGCDVVVAAGGDGTIGTIAGELLDGPTALGILPLGSVMNIPRMLGLPRDLEGAAEILSAGHVRTVDVGQAGDRPFFEAASVGMHAAMFREARRFDRGDWLSILRTVWVALRYRPARMVIDLDERRVRTRALMVAVANGPYLGVGMTVAPEARLDDGMFDVRVFRGFSKWELIRHLASIAFGRRRYAPHISTYRSSRVRIDAVHALPARADSRDLGVTPVEFWVRPQALRVVAPAPNAKAGDGP